MSKLTFDQVAAEVRKLASENPLYTYPAKQGVVPGCIYVATEDRPGCIFGQALLNLGVDKEQLAAFDVAGAPIQSVLHQLKIGASQAQNKWAGDVQEYQDQGTEWADAVRGADDNVGSERNNW